ncbi:MAG: DnaA/Hda family protein, partial [Betaproteobacteria bacterium]|nr:DnaA/Hda family protein [Betaproteobacteria bacterium]
KECVSKASKTPYTPFVVYGQSGAGKSHLLGAIANALRCNGKDLYFGGIAYLERITAAPGRHALIPEQYVFMDDAQRILACHDTQDALAALIDMFQASGKLLALSFDAHPAQYAGLGQKLRSRLVSGLVMEIKRPDMDIRRQYVQRKNTAHNLGLSKEQILALSHRYQDIRSIDGALARLVAYRDLVPEQGTDAAPPDISSILDRGGEHSFLMPVSIILTVAREFSLPPEELTGKNKDKTVSLARHIAILLCRELLGLSLIQTGRIFAGRDHSSVLYSIKKVKQLQESDKVMNKRVEDLRKLCLTKH